ncbi:MAG: hypothetical protein SVY10_00865 [Thermodesulfobacteriota bacterium]|nr:hypothetical protein [Thermodesulfobacteriota bacterium]
MRYDKEPHLSEEEIIQAVVDETDLPSPMRRHLSVCPVCGRNKERLANRLAQLGDIARAVTPVSLKGVTLPEKERGKRFSFWGMSRSRLLFAGLSVAMIIAVFLWTVPLRTVPQGDSSVWSDDMWEDYTFMKEIIELKDVALPQIYLDISGESFPTITEEFMDFLVPPAETKDFEQYESKEVQYAV